MITFYTFLNSPFLSLLKCCVTMSLSHLMFMTSYNVFNAGARLKECKIAHLSIVCVLQIVSLSEYSTSYSEVFLF